MGKNWLSNKSIIVTGASSGIGADMVRLLLEYNCRVLGVSRNETKAKEFSKKLSSDNYSYYCFDVGDKGAWEHFIEHLKSIDFIPDVIINNAGIMPPFKRACDTSIDVYEKVVKINYLSAVYSYSNILPLIEKSSTPTIVNVSSSSALATLIGTSPYTASKSALRGYTECIQRERKDIYVALVCPGFTKTEIFREQKQTTNEGIIGKISMPADKMAKKIIKKLRRHKKRIILGFDAHLMSGFYRIFPKFSTRVFAWIFKKTKLPLFDEVFPRDNER